MRTVPLADPDEYSRHPRRLLAMPRVPCPVCSRILNVPDAALGKIGSCPGCKHRFPIPDDLQLPPDAAAAMVKEPVARSPAGRKPLEPPEKKKKNTRKTSVGSPTACGSW